MDGVVAGTSLRRYSNQGEGKWRRDCSWVSDGFKNEDRLLDSKLFTLKLKACIERCINLISDIFNLATHSKAVFFRHTQEEPRPVCILLNN